eukprot:1195077-Prorocentrum_minimum.AAC.13
MAAWNALPPAASTRLLFSSMGSSESSCSSRFASSSYPPFPESATCSFPLIEQRAVPFTVSDKGRTLGQRSNFRPQQTNRDSGLALPHWCTHQLETAAWRCHTGALISWRQPLALPHWCTHQLETAAWRCHTGALISWRQRLGAATLVHSSVGEYFTSS